MFTPIHRKGTGALSVVEHAVVWCKGAEWGRELRKRGRGRSGDKKRWRKRRVEARAGGGGRIHS